MAHGERCFGTWRKSKLGTEDDGNIRINSHSGSTITGLHEKTNCPIEGTCDDGNEQNFSRIDPVTKKKVKYKNGKITQTTDKFFIKGNFEKETDAKDSEVRGKKKSAPPPDEWTAEKPF